RPLSPVSLQRFNVEVSANGRTYEVPLQAFVKPNGKFLVTPTGSALMKNGTSTETVAVNYYLPSGGSPAVLEFGGQAYEIELAPRGGNGTHLALRRTHPGASGVYTDVRAKTSVRLEPADQSAFLLIDLNQDSMQAKTAEGLKDEGKVVRRI